MSRKNLDELLANAITPERRIFRRASAMAVASVVAGVILLGLSGWFITAAALAGIGGVIAVQGFNYLLPSAAIRLFAIIRTAARYGERLYGHRATLMALATVRARLFDRILTVPDVRSVSAGDAVTRLVHDIDALEDSLVRKPALPAAMAGGVIGLGFTWLGSPWASLTLLTLIVAIVLLARWATPRLLTHVAADMAAALARLKESMIEHAAASPEILAYGMAPTIWQSLEADCAELDKARVRFARREAVLDASLTLAGGIIMAAVLAVSEASLPVTVLAVLAAAGVIESLAAYVRGVARNALVTTGFSRLEDMAGQKPPAAVEAPMPEGRTIAIEHGGQRIELNAGDRLGVSGKSGCGKTRLLETLAGVRPSDAATNSSAIWIDGRAIANFLPENQRALFAFSPQDAQLLSGTVADNLRLARPGLEDARLWEALEVACLAEDVRAMPQGLQQWLGDGGARLSGGQRKRLSIARAILAERPWLLLDEPSEGLDMATEARLCDRLNVWLQKTGTGLVVVSHRPALLALGCRQISLEEHQFIAAVKSRAGH